MSFQKVWVDYLTLQKKLKSGQINSEEFEAAVAQLSYKDSDEKWWRIRPGDGAWLSWNGTEWAVDEPTGFNRKSQQAEAPEPAETNKDSAGPSSLLDLLKILGRNLLRILGKKVVISIILALLVWFLHTFLMAYVNDGYYNVKSPILAMILSLERGKRGGILFWTLLTGLLSCLFVLIRRSGFKSLGTRFRSLPGQVKIIINRGGENANLFLLAGGALSMLISFSYAHRGDYVANRIVSLMLVLALILTLSGGQKGILYLIIRLSWQDLRKAFPAQIRHSYNQNQVNLVLLGVAAGFLVAALLPFMPWSGYLVLALLIGLAVFTFTRKVSPASFLVVCLGAAFTALLLANREVLACYGGYHEYGGSLEAWLNREGGRAGHVMSLGVIPALGAVAGYLAPLAAGELDDVTVEETIEEPVSNGAEPPVADDEIIPPADGDSRSAEEILANPRYQDRITDVNGKEWVYYKPVNDQAPTPFWVSKEEYELEQKQLNSGLIWDNQYGWISAADLAENRRLKKIADDAWQQELEESRKRGAEEIRLAAEKRAQEKRLKEEAEARVYKERYEEALRKRDEGMAEAEYWSSRVKYYDVATKTAEFVKAGADKSIDVLAEVTGPKGKSIRKAYKAASAFATGVGEGMATGEWADSMTDAAGTMAADLIEDRIGSDRYKKAYGVFREGAANAWQEGRKTYREGGDVAGSAAQAFLEGAADKASSELGDSLEGGAKYLYQAGEKGLKEGYSTFKDGGTVSDSLMGAGRGTLEGTVDASVDYLASDLFDQILPEKGAVSTDAMGEYQAELLESGRSGLADLVNDDWAPDYIHDEFRKEFVGKVTEAAQEYIKGDTFQIEPGL
jgi:hypothetical protein